MEEDLRARRSQKTVLVRLVSKDRGGQVGPSSPSGTFDVDDASRDGGKRTTGRRATDRTSATAASSAAGIFPIAVFYTVVVVVVVVRTKTSTRRRRRRERDCHVDGGVGEIGGEQETSERRMFGTRRVREKRKKGRRRENRRGEGYDQRQDEASSRELSRVVVATPNRGPEIGFAPSPRSPTIRRSTSPPRAVSR